MTSANDFQAAFPAFGAVLESLASGDMLVGVYDQHDTLIYANGTFRSCFGIWGADRPITFAELILHCVEKKCGPKIESADPLTFITDTQLRRRSSAGQRTFATDMVDGRWFWMTETLLTNGWITVIGADVTRIKKDEAEIRRARDAAFLESRTDMLTGLPNRRYSMEMLDVALRAFVRPEAPVCLAIIDLDNFKRINDELGHAAGDAVLQDFASAAKSTLRKQDTVGRIGGEEFIFVLPGSSLPDALDVISLLRSRVHDRRIDVGGPVLIHYSFSGGLTQLQSSDTRETALQRADKALYLAKRRGRDRVEGTL